MVFSSKATRRHLPLRSLALLLAAGIVCRVFVRLSAAPSGSFVPSGIFHSPRTRSGPHARKAGEDKLETALDVESCLPKIGYLPALDPAGDEVEPEEGMNVMPLFPLGSMLYLPHSQHGLNIFEPRYRELYDNILFSGSRRFVVPSVDPETQRFADVGVVLYLDDLKEVSEMTQDRVKYVCQHTVIGRVRIKRVLNQRSWFTRETYLRVETEPLEDVDNDEDLTELESTVESLLRDVVTLHVELKKGGFKLEILDMYNASRAEQGGLWSLAGLWEDLLTSRAQIKKGEFEQQVQKAVQTYVEQNPEEMKSNQMRFEDLPASVRNEVASLQDQFREDVSVIVERQVQLAQAWVQTDSHRGRLELTKAVYEEEYRRLLAQKSLQSVLGDL